MCEVGPEARLCERAHRIASFEAYTIVMHRMDAALRRLQQQAKGQELSLSMLGVDSEIMILMRDFILVTQRAHASVRLDCALNLQRASSNAWLRSPKTTPRPCDLMLLLGFWKLCATLVVELRNSNLI